MIEQRMAMMVFLPLSAAILTVVFSKRENLREASSIGIGVLLFLVCAQVASHVFAGERPELTLATPIPGPYASAFVIAFRAEPLGAVFSLVASGLWVATTCYAIGYMRGHKESNQTRFFACFGLAIFAAMGASMAKNLFTLFVFYEVMTLSTYPLVTHHGTEAARRGGRMYLSILMATSIGLLMLAIAWTWSLTGTLDFVQGGILSASWQEGQVPAWQLAVLLGLFAFGTGKAALMPFHKWLPAAMVAPTPVSALLHAVAVVKVGVFTIMKVSIYIFGLDLLRETGISVWLMYAASFTILCASLIAMAQDNLKRRLAYSTISQLAYIVLGASLANASGALGGSLHIVMHAMGKITLFFCAGAIYVAAHQTNISQMRGLGWRMPFTMIAFLLGTLSIIGVPPMGGAWSKWFLAMGAAQTEHPWLMGVLMISSLLNVAYLLPIPIRAFYLPPDRDQHHAGHAEESHEEAHEPRGIGKIHIGRIQEAPLFCVVPLCLTGVGSCLLFFYAEAIYRVLEPITG